MSDLLPPPIPVPDVDSAAWWDSLRDGVFAIDFCDACQRFQHPPFETCRLCGGPLALKPVLGTATLYSFIVQRRAMLPGFEVPYVLGLIELDDQPGLRVSGKVCCGPEAAAIGMRLQARIEEIGDSGYFAPVFDPIA
jgi:uncharacterized OB-fold protein